MDEYKILLNRIDNLIGKALIWDTLADRTADAQYYCQKYLMPDAWGKNVWISILDDAIRMRQELEATKIGA